MAVLYTNNATTTLAASITNVATTLTVATGTGALFPTITAPDYFYATLVDSSNNIEIVKVTARSSDTFTITRAQESTTARAYASGDKVELRVTAAGLANKLDKDTGGTLTGALALPANGLNVGSGQLAVSGGNVSASGSLTVTGDVTAQGNTTLGNASTDTVTINGTTVSIPNGVTFTNGSFGIGGTPLAVLHVEKNLAGEIGEFIYNPNATGYVGLRLGNSDRATNGDHLIYGSTVLGIRSKTGAAVTLEPAGTERVRVEAAGKIDLTGSTCGNIVTVAASTIDCTAGNFFSKTAAGALSWTFSSPPASRAYSFILELTNGGTGTQTWPTSVKWPGGSAPTLVASGVDVLGFITDDGGTTWRGVQIMKDSK